MRGRLRPSTALPPTCCSTSPVFIPAFAAGPSASSPASSAPLGVLSPRLSAMSWLTSWIRTPIQPRLALPNRRSWSITVRASLEGIEKPMPIESPEGE